MTGHTLFHHPKTTTPEAKPPVFTRIPGLALQRYPSSSAGIKSQDRVPDIVQEVLSAPGQPLDTSTRAFMEPRFGHDFSRVRVHTGSKAAESARAVNALAYTVGNEMVFGDGQYAPDIQKGRMLIAHELTHVLQQGFGPSTLRSFRIADQNGDASEREANRAARAVMDGLPAPDIRAAGFIPAIQTAQDPALGTSPPVESNPIAPTAPVPVCGPDVTPQVTAAIAKAKSKFGGWSQAKKEAQCDALDSLSTGALAWDIEELHANAWILNYRPTCATQGATPPCGSTVKVGTDCYYSGSPNYVIYGVMCKLCSDHFTSVGNQSGIDRFTQAKMLYWIDVYKGTGLTGLGTPSGNFGPSNEWAIAGYNGWPGGSTPSGDRNNCTPTCPTPYSGRAFRVYWLPQGFI
jgi:hypothetical protein